MKKFTVLVSALVLFSTPVLAGSNDPVVAEQEPTSKAEKKKLECNLVCIATGALIFAAGGGGGAEGTGVAGSNGVSGSNGASGT